MTTPQDPTGAILACILSRGNSFFAKVSYQLTENYFLYSEHKFILAVIHDMYDKGVRLDFDSINKALEETYPQIGARHFEPEQIDDGLALTKNELTSLSELECTESMCVSTLRDLLPLTSLNDQSFTSTSQARVALAHGANDFDFSLSTIGQAMGRSIADREKELRGEIVRLKTGFKSFDAINGGLENGSLYVLGGYPKVGKSLFVTQLALQLAGCGIPTALLSLEMGEAAIAKRCMRMLAGVPDFNMLTVSELQELQSKFSTLPFYISDSRLNVKTLFSRSYILCQQRGVRLLVIDYLHLIAGSHPSKNKTDEVNEVLKILVQLKNELNIPIILIAPLAIKGIQFRRDKSPSAADFKDTGQLPYDADYILFLWKPEEGDEDFRQLVVEKSRHGRQAVTIPLRFDEAMLTFTEIEPEQMSNISKPKMKRTTKKELRDYFSDMDWGK